MQLPNDILRQPTCAMRVGRAAHYKRRSRCPEYKAATDYLHTKAPTISQQQICDLINSSRVRDLRDLLLITRTTYARYSHNPEMKELAAPLRKRKAGRVGAEEINNFTLLHRDAVAKGATEPHATWQASDVTTYEGKKTRSKREKLKREARRGTTDEEWRKLFKPLHKTKRIHAEARQIFKDMQTWLTLRAIAVLTPGGSLEGAAMGIDDPVKRKNAFRVIAWRQRHSK